MASIEANAKRIWHCCNRTAFLFRRRRDTTYGGIKPRRQIRHRIRPEIATNPGLQGWTSGKIRMMQPADPWPFRPVSKRVGLLGL